MDKRQQMDGLMALWDTIIIYKLNRASNTKTTQGHTVALAVSGALWLIQPLTD